MSDPTPDGRLPNGRFGPGNPGRRPGTRNRLSHEIVTAMMEDFRANQAAVFATLRDKFPAQYFAVMAQLAPSFLMQDEQELASYSYDEAQVVVAQIYRAIHLDPDPRKALLAIAEVVAADPPLTRIPDYATADAPHVR